MFAGWEEILFGVPQGSISDPLLFNIFLCDLFWIMCETDFASYADDNTTYVSGYSIDGLIKSLESDSIKLLKWFLDNQMEANGNFQMVNQVFYTSILYIEIRYDHRANNKFH